MEFLHTIHRSEFNQYYILLRWEAIIIRAIIIRSRSVAFSKNLPYTLNSLFILDQ
jgi:hypothetical protein